MFFWQQSVIQAHNWLNSLNHWAYPAFISIYIVATTIGLPAIFLFLAAGSLFGFLPGCFVVSFADTLSIAVCYFLGKTLGRKTVSKWIAQRPHWVKFDRAVAQKGWKIVFLTRLSPIVPSNLLNYGFSLTKINFWQYLFVSWLGMLPVITLYVYFASVGIDLLVERENSQQIAASVLGFTTTVAAIAYTTKLMYHSLFDGKQERARLKNQEAKKRLPVKK